MKTVLAKSFWQTPKLIQIKTQLNVQVTSRVAEQLKDLGYEEILVKSQNSVRR